MNKIDSYREFVRQLGSTSPIERILKFVIENYILPEMEEELQVRVHFFRFFFTRLYFTISDFYIYFCIHYHSLSFIIVHYWKELEMEIRFIMGILEIETWPGKNGKQSCIHKHRKTEAKHNRIQSNTIHRQFIAIDRILYPFVSVQPHSIPSIPFNTIQYDCIQTAFKSIQIDENIRNIRKYSNKIE